MREAVSGAFAFASGIESTLQLERTTETLELTRQVQQSATRRVEAAARLESVVQILAAVFLVPSLVAAVYGALPEALWHKDQELRAGTMLAAMVVGGLLTYGLLAWWGSRGEKASQQR